MDILKNNYEFKIINKLCLNFAQLILTFWTVNINILHIYGHAQVRTLA